RSCSPLALHGISGPFPITPFFDIATISDSFTILPQRLTCKAGAPLAASPAFDCYALVSHYFLISLRSVITWWAIFHSPPCFSRTRFSDTRRLPVPTDEPLSLSI